MLGSKSFTRIRKTIGIDPVVIACFKRLQKHNNTVEQEDHAQVVGF